VASPIAGLLRTAFRLRDRLKAHPGFARAYRRVSREAQNRRTFAPLVVHEGLLADRVRMDAYRRAIERYVKPGDTVLDLGTGSGILAFLAARRGAKKVWAIDHADVLEAARHVADRNGVRGVELVRTHSRDLRLPERVDVLLHEQIGAYVFDEDLVANIVDARERLLKPSGRILPSRFEVFLEPDTLREAHRVPFLWEQRIDGIDFACLRDLAEATPGAFFASLLPEQIEGLLCAPEPAMHLDLSRVREEDEAHEVTFSRRVVRSGRLDGLALYFRARFDDDIGFGNAPGDPATNWQIPLLRVPGRACREGETVAVSLTMEDVAVPSTWRWTVR
jgi:protein arginine N-methyltransferase 1